MFRKKFSATYRVPCVSCNFSALVLYSGKTIQVVPCVCVKNKKG
jgi:hypothetical protein